VHRYKYTSKALMRITSRIWRWSPSNYPQPGTS